MGLLKEIFTDQIDKAGNRVVWPDRFQNRRTGKFFEAPNEEIRKFVFENHQPRYVYLMAGEGSGKTATASVKALHKLRLGLSGAIICTDLPMMKKVWDEIKQWIPKGVLIPEHEHVLRPGFSPYKGFELVFRSENGYYPTVTIGGLGDPKDYSKWESLNINWIYGDEFRSVPSDGAMKVLSGRIRMDGPNGEPPQMFIASTPTKKNHWMYKWFGPIEENDPLADFKKEVKIIRLELEDNLKNLSDNHIHNRGLTLNENEKNIFLKGEWGDSDNDMSFLDSIELWDRLYDPDLKPPRTKTDPERDWSDQLVLAYDGSTHKDSTAIVGLSRHPKRRDDAAVRIVKEFTPKNGKIDIFEVKEYFVWLLETYNVITVVYDPYQAHQLMEEVKKMGLSWIQSFTQQTKRLVSDQNLHDFILLAKIWHMNQPELRQHMLNAGIKYDQHNRKRIVKKTESQKIDAVIAVSMGLLELMRLNL